MKSARPLLIIAALAIAAAAALYAFSSDLFDRPPEPSLIGGPFQMVDQTGKPVDLDILQGKWSAVFFGFTYCPDVCPATLQALSAAVPLLKPAEAKKLQIVFVSVDSHGRPMPVDAWSPETPGEVALATRAKAQLDASRAAQ